MILRCAVAEDAKAVAAIYAPVVETTAISFEEFAPDEAEMRQRIARLGATFPWLVAESDGELEGYAYAGPHRARAAYRWSVDVSAYVREDARRRGIARKLYAGLFQILAAQGYHSAFAGVALPNAASLRLHRRTGFVEVGTYRNVGFKAGAWRDVTWLARTLRETESPPREPLPVGSIAAADIARWLAESADC